MFFWSWDTHLLFNVVLFAIFSPIFGYIIKTLSDELEIALKQKKKKTKLWLLMCTVTFCMAILQKEFIGPNLASVVSLFICIPIFGYLAMVGVIKCADKKRKENKADD